MEAADAFQQSVLDGVPDPIMVIGGDYGIKLMNRVARQFSPAVAGTSGPVFCYQASHQREAPCKGMGHPCPLEQVRESGQPVTVVHEHERTGVRRLCARIAGNPGHDGPPAWF